MGYNLSIYYFYLFRCKDNSLYSGITNNVKKREAAHNSGNGSKYVWARGGGKVVYFEKFRSKAKAMKRETEVKGWKKGKKEMLVRLK
jgi:putative endonuclease